MTDILSHLPILIVMIPFGCAYLTPFLGYLLKGWGRRITAIALFATLICSMLLVYQVIRNGPIIYHLSGVLPPLGIAFNADYLGSAISLLISGIVLLAVVYDKDRIAGLGRRRHSSSIRLSSLRPEQCRESSLPRIYSPSLFSSRSSPLQCMACCHQGIGKMPSCRVQIPAHRIGRIALILIGIGFLYITTGTLNMQIMAELLPPISGSMTVLAGLALLIAGICTKIGLFPLHVWMPDVYAYAPSIAPVLSTLALKAGVVALIRIVYTIFGPSLAIQPIPLYSVLALLGALAILICSVLAILQLDIRKMFAYSSGANIGCIVLGIGIATQLSVEGALLHMITHTAGKACLFLCADTILNQTGIRYVHEFRGLSSSMPYTMAAFLMASISIIGLPLSGGFMSKIYVAGAAIHAGHWIYAAILLIWTALTALYLFRILNSAYFYNAASTKPGRSHTRALPANEAPARVLVPLLLLGIACILLGFFVDLPMAVIRPAAELLIGGGL